MSERPSDKYSRVYWTIVDDPKFEHVYDDDAALAAWLRLLLIADQAWPASAHLPASCRPKSVKVLVGAGLVVPLPGGRYRVAGLDAERERRAGEQTNGGVVRARTGQRGPDGRYLTPTGGSSGGATGGSSDGLPAVDRPATSSDKTRQDETRRDEGDAPAGLDTAEGEDLPPLTQVIDYLEGRTRRTWHFRPGQSTWDTLNADVRDFGAEAVIRAMEAVRIDHPDNGQLIFAASRALHAIPSSETKPLDDEYVRSFLANKRQARSAARGA